jgi:hypothetical protein
MIHTRLNEWHPDRLLCSVDPITLTGLALSAAGSLGGAAAAGAFSSKGSAPTPTIPQAAPPQQNPTGKATTPTGNQPTFIGAAATPPVQSGQKSLLGQ